jgi:anti-anti-sigma factor
MRWSSRDDHGHAVVTISGPVDSEDAPRLRLLLKPQGLSCQLVVDISGVTFLAPAAVDVIAQAVGKLRTCAWPMAVIVGDRHPQVRQALEKAGLDVLEEAE